MQGSKGHHTMAGRSAPSLLQGLIGLAIILLLLWSQGLLPIGKGSTGLGSSGSSPANTTASPALRGQLPAEAHQTFALIVRGGPFPYDKDGTTFGNRERLLPQQKRGYYREYTVPTPRAKNRGARRIVCGGWQPAQPDACYYTADHYQSFAPIYP